MKVRQVLYFLSVSQEHKEFSKLFNALIEKRGSPTDEEAKAVSDAAGKITNKFIEMINPLISGVMSCCKVLGNEGLTKLRYSRRIREIRHAVRARCKVVMPDYYLFLDRKLPELWGLKNKKTKRLVP